MLLFFLTAAAVKIINNSYKNYINKNTAIDK